MVDRNSGGKTAEESLGLKATEDLPDGHEPVDNERKRYQLPRYLEWYVPADYLLEKALLSDLLGNWLYSDSRTESTARSLVMTNADAPSSALSARCGR